MPTRAGSWAIDPRAGAGGRCGADPIRTSAQIAATSTSPTAPTVEPICRPRGSWKPARLVPTTTSSSTRTVASLGQSGATIPTTLANTKLSSPATMIAKAR